MLCQYKIVRAAVAADFNVCIVQQALSELVLIRDAYAYEPSALLGQWVQLIKQLIIAWLLLPIG